MELLELSPEIRAAAEHFGIDLDMYKTYINVTVETPDGPDEVTNVGLVELVEKAKENPYLDLFMRTNEIDKLKVLSNSGKFQITYNKPYTPNALAKLMSEMIHRVVQSKLDSYDPNQVPPAEM